MSERYRYSWINDLEEPDFIALLNAVEHFRTDVDGKGFNSKGAIIWGEEVMDSIETMYSLLMSEWERKNAPDDTE